MKTMTCKQLGGACNEKFHAETFEEMIKLNKKHCMEMLQMGDEDHLYAMNEMSVIMEDSEEMKRWYANKKKEFETLPEQ